MKAADQNTAGILLATAVFGAIVVGLVMHGRRAAPSSSSGGLQPVGFFPDLKVGDVVAVDPVAAMMPGRLHDRNVVICRVDLILRDPELVSVRATVDDFAGTIPRASIRKVFLASDLVL